jgi:hypothetical protein
MKYKKAYKMLKEELRYLQVGCSNCNNDRDKLYCCECINNNYWEFDQKIIDKIESECKN